QLRTQIFQTGENPFLSSTFKRVETADMRANIVDDVEPCIVLATSGMMSGGPVLEYFKGWADNQLHALLFVGFQSEGSLGGGFSGRPARSPSRIGGSPSRCRSSWTWRRSTDSPAIRTACSC